jgi:pyruvate dehydrogenase E2 component (dihydrolipoamide acetyltransferase)
MATKVVMEALSPTMEEGRLVKWLKSEGDTVAKGDVLAEVETDKAVMELVARADGVLRKQLIGEGDTSPVGDTIGVIAGADEDVGELTGGAKSAEAPQASSSGETEPAKTAAEPTVEQAEQGGTTPAPRKPEESQGEASVPPQEKAPSAPRAPHPDASPDRPAAGGNGGRVRSSPLARRLASEQGVDLGTLEGSGPGGRIVKRDIETAVERGGAPTSPRPAAASSADYQDTPLSQMRKTIARRLAESIGPIPTFYLTSEVDLERVAEMREAMTAMGDEFKVSYNDIIMKAVATALALHPEVNAHWMGDRIRQFRRVHLGMAVAVEDGLITPVIFDADRKRMSEISQEARELAKRARDRRLKPEEYTGATFSVSNLGMFGIDQFTAIINPPECGILAIGGVEEKPVVEDGELTIRRRMRITMSCDHRAIDGATGARFLQTLRRMLENPLMLVH